MLLFHSSSLITASVTARKMTFDVSTDLVPVAMVADGPMLVAVSSKSGIKTPEELVSAARAKPGSLTSCSGGVGSVGHMAAELLNKTAKVQMLHVPYKGATPALMDLAAGTVDMLVASYTALAPQITSGRVVPIAVTSLQPNAAFPALPTMASAAPGYTFGIWYGMFAPAGMPAAMVQRLNREVNEIAMTPQIRALLEADGASTVAMTPEELGRRIKADQASWTALAREKNIVAD
jgi:tripartite-type tricarboxylate transporter receptor subunit TctC